MTANAAADSRSVALEKALAEALQAWWGGAPEPPHDWDSPGWEAEGEEMAATEPMQAIARRLAAADEMEQALGRAPCDAQPYGDHRLCCRCAALAKYREATK